MRNWLSWCNVLYTLVCREMDIQSGFSFKFWVLMVHGDQGGECWSWSPITKSTSSCPDRGQVPQLEGSGPHRNAYKRGHTNQSSLLKMGTSKIRRFDPLRRAARCTTPSRRPPFFLNTGSTSGSRVTAGPTVQTHRPLPSYGSGSISNLCSRVITR
jgi:hypothetical protein